jgi:peptide/nickel transport system substrate-binding protein
MNTKLTRRGLLKAAGVATAAAVSRSLPHSFPVPALAQSAKTVTIGINATLESLDVHTAIGPNIIGARIFGLFTDSLVQTGKDGQLHPMLATEWENDGLAWRFKLREGVVFHDGTVMTADDVVYSFSRILDPNNPQPSGFAQDFQRYVAKVEATGDLEVTFTTMATDPLLPIRLDSYWAGIVPRAATEAADPATLQFKPIGAGPYKVVEFKTDDRIVLERHSEYWGGTPAASQVVVRFVPETATRIAALQAGDVDLITQVPVDQIGVIDGGSGIHSVSSLVRNYLTVNINAVKGPTADVNVRRALALAIDRELIVDTLWEGRSRAMNDYLLPGIFGYDSERPVFPYDPDAARAALDASSYSGEAINFQTTAGYYPNDDPVMTAISQMWRDVGVTVNYDPLEGSAFLDLYFAGEVMTNLQSRGTTGGDAQLIFKDWAPGTLWVPAYYQPPEEFNQLLQETAQSLDQEQRYADFRRMAEIFDNDVPFTPLYQTIDIFGVREDLVWEPGPTFIIDFRPDSLSFK